VGAAAKVQEVLKDNQAAEREPIVEARVVYGELGSNTCPEGFRSITSEPRCDAARQELGVQYNGEGTTNSGRLPYCWLGAGGRANFNPNGDNGHIAANVARSKILCEVNCIDCPAYEELSAQDKLAALWSKITSDEFPAGPYPTDMFPSQLYLRNSQGEQALNGTMGYVFDRLSDENPTMHYKTFHVHGSVATVRIEPVANSLGLTGLFEHGSQYAILRNSIIADWTEPCKGGIDGNFNGCLKPSIALKVLRDNGPSSNLLAQANLGQGVGENFAFWDHAHATWLPKPTGAAAAVITALFEEGGTPANAVGTQEWATDGAAANQSPNQINTARVVYFMPTNNVKGRFSTQSHDAREDFAAVNAGTHVYDIVVPTDAQGCIDGNGNSVLPVDLEASDCAHTVVGRVVTTSRFVASAWGDQRLFFRHERVDKGGTWRRQSCRAPASLPSNSEYRMADDLKRTCTQNCWDGGQPDPSFTCPFARLEAS